MVSGINAGPNLGDDVIYSGTVAGAIEGRFLGLPSLAVSLAGKPAVNYATAAQITTTLIQRLQQKPMSSASILNINVPDVDIDAIQSIESTRQGFRHQPKPMCLQQAPDGSPIYWIGPQGNAQYAEEGTDFHAIKQNRVSVTALQVDMTHHQSTPILNQWLSDLNE